MAPGDERAAVDDSVIADPDECARSSCPVFEVARDNSLF